MGLITKEVEVKVNSKTVKYYESLGYKIPKKEASDKHVKRFKKGFTYDFGNIFIVKVDDLTRNSKVKVLVKCDYCNKEKYIEYRKYLDSVEKYDIYACNKCLHYKTEKTNFTKYGTPYYSSTLECKEKVKNTCIDIYGTDCPARNEKIKEKTRLTNLQKFGFENPMQSQEIREKVNETLCKNGNVKTSKQQLYLHNLYGGKINYPISYYSIDICFPEEKLIIEYDGGGHDLRVVLGRLTQEEFNQKEIIRNNIIKREGYKQMRIISTTDLLPSDETLLQMLTQAKEYFSTYPEHSWYEYNIDTSTVRNAEHKEGVFFDYGELRKITEVA